MTPTNVNGDTIPSLPPAVHGGDTVSDVPPPIVETPSELGEFKTSLQDLRAQFQAALKTFGEPNEPELPPSDMTQADEVDFNIWLQNGGLVEVIRAKITAAEAEADAQQAASKMVIEFAIEIFNEGMKKVASMKKEAELTYQKGMLEAHQYMVHAVMSLVSGAITGALAIRTSFGYAKAKAKVRGQGKLEFGDYISRKPKKLASYVKNKVAELKAPAHSRNLPPDQQEFQVKRLGVDGEPSFGDYGRAPAGAPPLPAGAPPLLPAGAAPALPAGAPPELRIRRQGNVEEDEKGPVQGLSVKGGNKTPISQEKMQRLNQMDQVLKSLGDAVTGFINNILDFTIKTDLSDYDLKIKMEQANQVAIDTFIKVLDTTMEIMRKFIDSSNTRIDQNYNLNSFLQALSIGFQKS